MANLMFRRLHRFRRLPYFGCPGIGLAFGRQRGQRIAARQSIPLDYVVAGQGRWPAFAMRSPTPPYLERSTNRVLNCRQLASQAVPLETACTRASFRYSPPVIGHPAYCGRTQRAGDSRRGVALAADYARFLCRPRKPIWIPGRSPPAYFCRHLFGWLRGIRLWCAGRRTRGLR